MEAVATENDVSPADKPDETSVNRRKLEKLDADISGILKTMVKSDGRDKQLSSEIISAIVMHSGYTPLFWGMSLLHPLALLFYWQLKPPRPAKGGNSLFQPSSSNASV